MLVFCEDCGKRHSVKGGGDEHGRLQFRCDACGFLVTATSVPPKNREASDPDSSVVLSCSHDELDLGAVIGGDGPEKTVFLAAKDGRKVDLDVTVLSEVQGNISVGQVSANVFKIRVVAAPKMGADLRNGYDGPGLEFFDNISGALLTVPVVFSRIKPSFILKPALVDLGKISADVLTEGNFVIKNCTSAPLAITVNPDPQYFSLTSYFKLISETSLIMAAGEEREIVFSVRFSDDACKDAPFEQVVLVKASDSDERPAQRIRIIATLAASASTPPNKEWGAIM
jgi:hypothetical protein